MINEYSPRERSVEVLRGQRGVGLGTEPLSLLADFSIFLECGVSPV